MVLIILSRAAVSRRHCLITILSAIVASVIPAIAHAQPPESKTGSITGVVTDSTSGATIPDVEVRMFHRPEGGGNRLQFPIIRVRTDANGQYRFENLAPGDYGIYAFHGTKASRMKHMDFAKAAVAADGSSSPVDLKLTEALSLKVRVISAETGKPIPQALVRLRWTDLDDNAETDENGIALINGLTPHDQHVEAMAAGYQLVDVSQTLKDALTEVQFNLPPGGSIPGKVVDDQGKPLSGVSISASPERGSARFDYVKSDEQGKFTLNYVPISQSIRIGATLKDHQYHSQSFSLNGEPYRPLEITLARRPDGGDLELTVTDADGRPVVGAEVTNYSSSSSEYHRVKTDDSGRVSISKLYLPYNNRNPELSISAEGFAAQRAEVQPSKSGPAKLAITLEKGHRLRGRLVNAAGEPVAGASVYFNDGNRGFGGLGGKLTVDKEGRFSSTSLPPDVTLNISARGYTPQDRLKAPVDQDAEHVITLEPTGRFRGIITNAKTKEPVRRFTVKLGFARNPPAGARRSTGMPADWGDKGRTINDQAGRLLWEELPNNTAYDLIVEAEGFESTRLAAAVTSLGDSDLRIELQPIDAASLVEIAGIILDAKGEPIEGISVHLIGVDPAIAVDDPNGRGEVGLHLIRSHQAKNIAACKFDRETTTAADGRFRFPDVPGKYKSQLVYWGDNTPGTRIRDLDKKTPEQLRQLEVFAPAGVTIKGTIDLKKYPNPGYVTARHSAEMFDSQEARFAAGQDRSKFTIRALSAGEISVALMSEPVTRRENGSTFYSSSSLEGKTVIAKPGETIEVNFN